jgi:hypothetical protein
LYPGLNPPISVADKTEGAAKKMETEFSRSILVFALLLCSGVVLHLLPAGCKVKSTSQVQSASQLKSAEDFSGESYSYERSLKAAEEAKTRLWAGWI